MLALGDKHAPWAKVNQ